MAFTTIFITPGLPMAERRRAARVGPWAVATRSDYPRLLRSAGFAEVQETPLTDEFRATSEASLGERDAHAAELAPLEPPGRFDEGQRERRTQLSAIEEGLLQRSLYVASVREPRRSPRNARPIPVTGDGAGVGC